MPIGSLMKSLINIEKLINEGLDVAFYTGETKEAFEPEFTIKETISELSYYFNHFNGIIIKKVII